MEQVEVEQERFHLGAQVDSGLVLPVEHGRATAALCGALAGRHDSSPGNTRSQTFRSSSVSSTGPFQPQSWQVAVSTLLIGFSSYCRGNGGAGGIRTREAAPSG